MPNFTYAAFSEVRASKLGPDPNAPGLACRGASLYGRIRPALSVAASRRRSWAMRVPTRFFHLLPKVYAPLAPSRPGGCTLSVVPGAALRSSLTASGVRGLAAGRFPLCLLLGSPLASCALLFSWRSAGPRALWRAGFSLLVPIHSSAWKRSVLRS
jgi:hypothetical protein